MTALTDPHTPAQISVVLCTWNRADLLDGALAALVAQESAPPYEIVIVDNGSTDATADVAQRYTAAHRHVRYVFEGTPGLSHARNTGIASTTGRIVAFTDDDVRVPSQWIRAIAAAAEHAPDAGCFGGPVLPLWTAAPAPAWLGRAHWSALGLQDYGDEPLRVDPTRPVCLIGANLVIRRDVLDAVGPFDPSVQRVGNGIGSTEDREYHGRLWASGQHGLYDPALRVETVVTGERLTKRYHRRWQFGHGRHIARMRLPEIERSRLRLLGVPVHLIRQAVVDLCGTLVAMAQRDRARAFDSQLRLCFAAGFICERLVPTTGAGGAASGRAPGVRNGDEGAHLANARRLGSASSAIAAAGAMPPGPTVGKRDASRP